MWSDETYEQETVGEDNSDVASASCSSLNDEDCEQTQEYFDRIDGIQDNGNNL
jgi:hypothetical protein